MEQSNGVSSIKLKDNRVFENVFLESYYFSVINFLNDCQQSLLKIERENKKFPGYSVFCLVFWYCLTYLPAYTHVTNKIDIFFADFV